MHRYNLQRFLDAQNQVYLRALSEIRTGQKHTHWMWFIFPQIKGLGNSENAMLYAIENLEEATAYLAHPVLGKNLIKISNELLKVNGKSATDVLGHPDDLKLRSSMTLFASVENSDPVFQNVLDRYFSGKGDELTIQIIALTKPSTTESVKQAMNKNNHWQSDRGF